MHIGGDGRLGGWLANRGLKGREGYGLERTAHVVSECGVEYSSRVTFFSQGDAYF